MFATRISRWNRTAPAWKRPPKPANCSSKPSTRSRKSISSELRPLADLVEAKANYERAVGRTLEVNRVSIADAKSGEVERETLIPGTLHGQVVGTEKLSFNSGQR